MIAAQVAAIIFFCFCVPAVIPAAAAYAGSYMLSAITAAALLAKCGGSEGKCAWFVLIAAIPVAGAVIYLIATAKSRRYGILNVETENNTPLGEAAQKLCGACAAGYERAEYFPTCAPLFERMFNEIKNAKSQVCVEFFIVCGGVLFDKFLSACKCASDNGAKIYMLADGVGCAFKLKRRDVKRLKDAGVQLKVFHRLIPLPRSRLNLRDHRKIVTVDGKVAFTGGINLADEYANITSPYGYWKDSGVAVYGEAAKVFEGMFFAMWKGEHTMKTECGGQKLCLAYCDSPPCRTFCEDMYVQKISAAQERVHILTPYFCVSEKLAGALSFAARRGVDVKVILPHVPDKPYAFELSKATAQTLKDSGIKFFEFTPGFMHAKALICDGEAFLGSYNFDFRSMRLNFECGVMLDGGVCGEAEKDFANCLALSQPMTEGKISPAKRFWRFVLRLFAPLI